MTTPRTPATEAGQNLLGVAYLEGDARQEGVNLRDAILAIEAEARDRVIAEMEHDAAFTAALQQHQDANVTGPEHRYHCGGTCAGDVARRYRDALSAAHDKEGKA